MKIKKMNRKIMLGVISFVISLSMNNHLIAAYNLVQTLDENNQGHKYSINSVAFSLDGTTIASGSCDKTIKIWHLNDQGQWVQEQTLDQNNEGHTGSIYSVAFSLDGMTMASGSCDKTIKIWTKSNSTRFCGTKNARNVWEKTI